MAAPQAGTKHEDELQSPNWQAELSFRDWKARLEAARSSWASAPPDLKPSLLLQSGDLQEATNWLISRPGDLSPQQQTFVRKSIARSYSSAQEEGRQKDAERKSTLKWYISFGATISAFLLFLGLQITLYDIWVKTTGAVYVADLPRQYKEPQQPAVPSPSPAPVAQPVAPSPPTTTHPPIGTPAAAEVPPAAVDSGNAYGEAVTVAVAGSGHTLSSRPAESQRDGLRAAPVQLAELALAEVARDPVRARLIALEALDEVNLRRPLERQMLPALAALNAAGMTRRPLLADLADTTSTRVSFSRDGRLALLVAADQSARWTPLTADVPVHGIVHQAASILTVDDAWLALADTDDGVGVWPAGAAQPAAVLRGHEAGVTALAVSSDRQRLVTASWDETVKLWDAHSGRTLLTLRGHVGPTLAAALSPDGMRIVTAGEDRTAQVWNAADGRRLLVLEGHESAVEQAAFDATSQHILTTSRDGTARLWDAATGTSRATLRPQSGVVASAIFSPSGRRIAVLSSRSEVLVWDIEHERALPVAMPSARAVTSLTFDPSDGDLLATRTDGTAIVVHPETSAVVSLLNPGAGDKIIAATFSGDGAQIMAITARHDLLTWRTHPSLKAMVDAVRREAPRCLSPEERRQLQVDQQPPEWCTALTKPLSAAP